MSQLINELGVSSIFYNKWRNNNGYLIAPETHDGSNPLPLPPVNLRQGYPADDEQYQASGRADATKVRESLISTGLDFGKPLRGLEVGCSTGRVLRWFEREARCGEMWGCDIDSNALYWTQQNLTPFNCLINSTYPHLPFEDRYFDFVYLISVFTHMAELSDAWFLELRRLVRPGGRIYFTFFDEKSWHQVDTNPRWERFSGILSEMEKRLGPQTRMAGMVVDSDQPKSLRTIYRREFLRAKLARWFAIEATVEQASGFQNAFVLGR